VEDKAGATQPGGDKLQVSRAAATGAGAAAAGAIAKAEDATANTKALRDANARITELEKTVKDLQKAAELRNQTMAVWKKRRQVVFDQHSELSVDGNHRQPRVARLLKPLDEERPIARFGDDVRVEIVALHALGVRQNDLPDAKRRELSPQPAHDLRAW
jgi:hypothetical protein